LSPRNRKLGRGSSVIYEWAISGVGRIRIPSTPASPKPNQSSYHMHEPNKICGHARGAVAAAE
jgi:hypothetical protein